MTVSDTLAYPVRLEPDDNATVLVRFPDFPEAHTYGDDRHEALARAVDALSTVLDEYIRSDRDVPAPSAGDDYVPVPAMTAVKLQLYRAMRRQQMTKAELARRLGWYKPQVDRLFKVFHHSRLDQLERAFAVLGMRLVVTAEEGGHGAILRPCTPKASADKLGRIPIRVRERDFDISR
jgi:antitoxin HicB